MSRPFRIFWWLVFLVGAIYFFLPLIGTFAFTLRDKPASAADRKSTRLNSSHIQKSRMPSSA